jgi:hypothetical protein
MEAFEPKAQQQPQQEQDAGAQEEQQQHWPNLNQPLYDAMFEEM